jgi:hypothetical protein
MAVPFHTASGVAFADVALKGMSRQLRALAREERELMIANALYPENITSFPDSISAIR